MPNNLDIFRNEYLYANTWAQRKDGAPLYLLDRLNAEELKTAELELIHKAGSGDTWPILGLGHIKSSQALPKLYILLDKCKNAFKVTIANAIYQICKDPKMIDITLEELPKITDSNELIDVLYLLPGFSDDRVTEKLNGFRNNREYLVAYNATRAMGLPTDDVIEKFKQEQNTNGFWNSIFGG